MERFNRVKLLIGSDKFEKISSASVLLFGIGGVGGFTAEALVRSGIGSITIIDNDKVSITNINRQIIADQNSLGMDKVFVMKQRLLSINPNLKIQTINCFYLPENADSIDFSVFDYVIDAVDTVSAKLAIIERAKAFNKPIISCMGTGGKLDISSLTVGDVFETKGCPLARVMRRELKKRGINGLKVVYSTEQASSSNEVDLAENKGKDRLSPPSMIFVPSVAGIMLADQVIKDLIKI